ncbi:DarT ssDNA thymidine ADP-ribosyltransferase family protein [Agromyces sp. MMS24-JH15]|uniref:DarT ssDNA thymidine ADP-ribosyltransferase family protein n=1 Tax=Agromyces sp. MMS24-JH15 TaxID=3243765 RepID=UPI003747FA0B
MADECIHGFDDGLCAICFPPPVPEGLAAPTRTSSRSARVPGTRPRTAPSRTSPSSRVAGASASRLDGPPIDAKALRIYHVTHLDNLARILGSGGLQADAGDPAAEPVVDIAAPAVREYRRSAVLSGTDQPIAAHVPFFLHIDALLWDAVRRGDADPRLVDGLAAGDFIVLVSTVGQAAGARADTPGILAVADGDPALPGAEVATEPQAIERMLRLLARGDAEGLRAAELLVADHVALERFVLIAVPNEPVRDRVKRALDGIGVRTRVAVYPPWFQPALAPGA